MSKTAAQVPGAVYQGKFILPDGSYEGEYVIGPDGSKLRQGSGIQTDSSGQFKGQWVGDVRSGLGSFVSVSGCRYEGAFVADNFHGAGTYTWTDGASYSGSWVRGVMHGMGAYTDPTGTMWTGRFSNGLFVAEGKPPTALR